MSAWVVDASVVIKWFAPEIHSPLALQILESHARLLAPDLLAAEIANILWKKVRSGELRHDDAREILRATAKVGITLVSSAELNAAALEIAVASGRSAYDSLHVALAIRDDARLVTADPRLAAAFANTPLREHICDLRHAELA